MQKKMLFKRNAPLAYTRKGVKKKRHKWLRRNIFKFLFKFLESIYIIVKIIDVISSLFKR
jgi:hypothetical protein